MTFWLEPGESFRPKGSEHCVTPLESRPPTPTLQVGSWGGLEGFHPSISAEPSGQGKEEVPPPMTHCAIDPFLALVAAKEAHQIGARIYSATTTEYIRDV